MGLFAFSIVVGREQFAACSTGSTTTRHPLQQPSFASWEFPSSRVKGVKTKTHTENRQGHGRPSQVRHVIRHANVTRASRECHATITRSKHSTRTKVGNRDRYARSQLPCCRSVPSPSPSPYQPSPPPLFFCRHALSRPPSSEASERTRIPASSRGIPLQHHYHNIHIHSAPLLQRREASSARFRRPRKQPRFGQQGPA